MTSWARFYAEALRRAGWPSWCALLEAESVDWAMYGGASIVEYYAT